MDGKTKEALRQLQAEVRQLQASLGQFVDVPDSDDEDKPGKKERHSAYVQYTVSLAAAGADDKAIRPHHSAFTELQLRKVSDEAAAALGYALASPQKIALLRALWHSDVEASTTLGGAAHLTTGSLYHHLRELIRAGLVVQSGRNRYQLSPRGARVLPLVLALAAEE